MKKNNNNNKKVKNKICPWPEYSPKSNLVKFPKLPPPKKRGTKMVMLLKHSAKRNWSCCTNTPQRDIWTGKLNTTLRVILSCGLNTPQRQFRSQSFFDGLCDNKKKNNNNNKLLSMSYAAPPAKNYA